MFGLYDSSFTNHSYTFCYIHGRKQVNQTFSTREQANKQMYKICSKKGIYIVKTYDDKHDKTYFGSNGAEFHINRVY